MNLKTGNSVRNYEYLSKFYPRIIRKNHNLLHRGGGSLFAYSERKRKENTLVPTQLFGFAEFCLFCTFNKHTASVEVELICAHFWNQMYLVFFFFVFLFVFFSLSEFCLFRSFTTLLR